MWILVLIFMVDLENFFRIINNSKDLCSTSLIFRNDAQTSVESMPHPKVERSHEGMAGSSKDMPFNGSREKVHPNAFALLFPFRVAFILLVGMIMFQL